MIKKKTEKKVKKIEPSNTYLNLERTAPLVGLSLLARGISSLFLLDLRSSLLTKPRRKVISIVTVLARYYIQ